MATMVSNALSPWYNGEMVTTLAMERLSVQLGVSVSCNDTRQLIHTHLPLSQTDVHWYLSVYLVTMKEAIKMSSHWGKFTVMEKRVGKGMTSDLLDAVWLGSSKVRSDGSLLLGLWLVSPVCWLPSCVVSCRMYSTWYSTTAVLSLWRYALVGHSSTFFILLLESTWGMQPQCWYCG